MEIKRTTLKKIGAAAQLNFTAFKDLSPGYSGSNVSLVQTSDKKRFIIKLTPREKEPSFANEPVENRVYGARFSNLQPSSILLLRHGIKTSKLLVMGTIGKYNYAVLEYLEGQPIGDALVGANSTNAAALYKIIGEQLGKLHRITRKYQGWIQAKSSYSASWETLFFRTLSTQLNNAAKVSRNVRENKKKVEGFITQKREVWTNPKNFVFSHTDGFQGMVNKENSKWIFKGMIDIEDYQFTDQRLVMCGIELASQMFVRKNVPKVFWNTYQRYVSLDRSYERLNDLFALLYLFFLAPRVSP